MANADNDSPIQKQAQAINLNILAKVHDLLEMWQGSQNLLATHKEFRAQHKQMTAVGYI
jgi:hypothetical protein